MNHDEGDIITNKQSIKNNWMETYRNLTFFGKHNPE